MCQELKRILVRRSLSATGRLKKLKRRRYVRIYTECKHEIPAVYACTKTGESALIERGEQRWQWLAFDQWPDVVKQFFHERIMAKPKPKKKPPAESRLAAAKRDADAKLAEWLRKAKMADSKIKVYARKVRNLERQIAAQQAAGIAGAGSRSFDFNE